MKFLIQILLLYLTFGQYSCFFNINSNKYEEIIMDFGRQFISGLCSSLGERELFGIKCAEGNKVFIKQEHEFYSIQDEDVYPTVIVDPLGTAVGTVMKTYENKPFNAYMGIRFATAGTFEMPLIYEDPWETDFMGGFDATYIKQKCPQHSLVLPVITGVEDCLFLNIFTPVDMDPTKKYPVMVYIYGGLYISGDGSLYVPSRLMEEDVIVVVLQYRLGTLGFLYSGTKSAPGNMGLMDQITALRWVKKYIKYFNGDYSNITLFGESAGSTSTSLLHLSPQTTAAYNNGNQLINRAILQSGSALEVWVLDRDYQKSLILHGNQTGCYSEGISNDGIVNCMKKLPINKIVEGFLTVLVKTFNAGILGFYGAVPVIQDELMKVLNEPEIRDYIVVPREPEDIINDGDFLPINIMAGSVRDEGSLVLGLTYLLAVVPNGLNNTEDFLKYLSIPKLVEGLGFTDYTGAISNSIRLAFLPNSEMGQSDQMTGGLVDFAGMMMLKSGAWRMTQLMSRVHPEDNIYFYSFEYESNSSMFDWIFFSSPDIPIEGGITHADDLLYLFAFPGNPNEKDKETTKKMCTLWANFAQYGDPTSDESNSWQDKSSKWLPYSYEHENFLLMSDDFKLREDFVKRWNYNIY